VARPSKRRPRLPDQAIPRRSRAAGEIICGVQGGSHTMSTFA